MAGSKRSAHIVNFRSGWLGVSTTKPGQNLTGRVVIKGYGRRNNTLQREGGRIPVVARYSQFLRACFADEVGQIFIKSDK
jgi:hypothetical protein